ncbi:MAG: lipopolysaccharide biosynthesis protein, partial [Magnetococcales bacterium]|nr:lipopolysaccharide biosynthesis protein [Magnetococcales bacterium]
MSNLVGLVANIGIQAIVPRSLGPETYGNFHFLTNFFNQVISFLDLGTSTAFYTKLSKRQNDHGLITFYLIFMVTVLTALFVMVVISTSTSAHNTLWPGQKLQYIYYAAFYGALLWVGRICTKAGDAYGLTVGIEKITILQKVLGLFLILGLFFTNYLTLETYFYYYFIIISFMAVGQIWIIIRSTSLILPLVRPSIAKLVSYLKEFYTYSHPLAMLALVTLITGVLDRWLLQTFAGSAQQGFYSLAYQIGTVCFIFSQSMTALIQREFAIAFGKKDLQEMARLFRRHIPTLYFISAYLACFIIIHSSDVLFFFGGEAYAGGALTATIMLFFPIHMTYGQLSNSLLIATDQTRLYRNLGIISVLVGLPVTYYLIAPITENGLELGSVGLAIKMVLMQFILVNVMLYYNTKLLKLSFLNYFTHQVGSVVILLTLAFISNQVVLILIEPKGILEMVIGFF